MALNDIKFVKQNGGMARQGATEDPISGLLLGLNGALDEENAIFAKAEALNVGEGKIYVFEVKYVEQLEAFGIKHTALSETLTDEEKAINFIHYHASEFFSMSELGVLYLAVKLQGEIVGEEIESLQNYAGGKLRQVGIAAAGEEAITAEQIEEYQTVAKRLEENHMPVSLLVALRRGDYSDINDLTSLTLTADGRCNVSVLVAQDLSQELLDEQNVASLNEVASIGTLLGAVSAASVHESIAWVGKFPLKVEKPGFVTGELLKETPMVTLNLLNDARLIFYRSHVGISDVYYNDSFTLDEETSDYCYIENVRTLDKAVRGIRSNLLPYLNSPLRLDAEKGTLSADMVAVLETEAGKALEDMERRGELSGYKVKIDAEQNVLATSELEIVIKNVALGVMRSVKVKIGFANKLN